MEKVSKLKWRAALYSAGLACLFGTFLCSMSLAQTEASESDKSAAALDEIVVTAERREATIQDTALSMAALSGESMRDRQITNVEGLLQSLTDVQFAVNKQQPKIAIRGLGLQNISVSGPEPRIAFYLDGVYVARPEAIMGTFFDVQRVEVLRGPQGTLYGRNATGGAINVITADPTDDLSGHFQIGYGNYGDVTAEGAISGPLADKVSARLAFRFEDNDGYTRNITTGDRVDQSRPRAARAKIKFEPTADFTILLSADYAHEKARSGAYYFFGPYTPGTELAGTRFGGTLSTGERVIASDYDPHIDDERYGFAADVHGTLGTIDVRSITGYRVLRDDNNNGDVDLSSVPLSFAEYFARSHQVTQELRLSQKTGRLDWLLGGYFFNENLESGNMQGLSAALFSPTAPILPIRQGSTGAGMQSTRAYAIFGQVRYDIFDRLTLNVGGRFGWEKTSVNEKTYLDLVDPFFGPYAVVGNPIPAGATGAGAQRASRSANAFTPKVTLEYRPRENFLTYVTYSRGFKSGGFNLGSVQPSFAPEKLTDYEAGLKTSWLDRRLQTNLAVFHYDYTNLQVTTLTTVNNVTINATTNAAAAKVDGLELDVVLQPVDVVRLEASYAYLDARYTRYSAPNTNMNPRLLLDLSGNRLSQAPKSSLNLAAEYRMRSGIGDFTLRGEGQYVSRTFYTQFNEDSLSTSPYELFNAFLTYMSNSQKWTAGAYIRNIANRTVIRPNVVYPGFLGRPVSGSLEPPRLYGVTFGYQL